MYISFLVYTERLIRMKKNLSILLSLIILASFFPITLASANPYTSHLILYYDFEDGSNAVIGDNATAYNVSFTKDGIAGKACYLDGNTSYLKLPDSINKSLKGDFSVTAWVKLDTLSYWMRIFDFGSDDSSYAFLGLSSPNDLRYAQLTEATQKEINMTAQGCVKSNEWLHFSLVRDSKVMKLYINGILVSESTSFGDHTPSDIENSSNYIGKSQFSADPYFNGHIDEFKIFDTALSPIEIIENMSSGIESEYAYYIADSANLTNSMTVKENITLPQFSSNGTSIAWASDNESVISSTGALTRPEEDTFVTLTATVCVNGISQSFSYSLFVPSKDNVNARIKVDASQKGVDINSDMIGLFFEDINYAADGGLYAECVQNRSFEAVNAQWDGVPKSIPDYAWTFSSAPAFSNENPLNENNTTYLKFENTSALTSFSNACYDGFPVKSGEKFDFSAFIRANGAYPGQIMVTLFEDDRIIGRTYIDSLSSEWTKYEKTITAVSDAENAKIRITVLDSVDGSIDFDMISLFPQNTWMNRKNGLRADLVQMLKELHPGFLRFPGGCIIEGYNLSNRYSWKDTVGKVEERKENWNRWQLHTGGDGRYAYCQSYGLGFYEYFLLCEDIGAFPLPVVNVGIGCQYQTGDVSSMDELYSVYIQDALDLIEFANGSTDTKWGALRAEMGHEEPFNLEYIGIGNEQWENDKVNFFERYEAFEKEIHAAYPDIKLIATSGPDASGTKFDDAWTFLHSHSDNGETNFAYAVDEHYYRTPDWFYTNLDRYDGYDRSSYKVFAGEYASRYYQGKDQSNLNNALSIAAFMTSLEKNADVVALASYAPLFSREGYTQWYPDLIGFDNSTVFASPDYYVQSMYSNNTGSYTVANSTENYDNAYTPHGKIGISTWLTSASFYDISLTDNLTGEPIEFTIPTPENSSWALTDNIYTQTDSGAYNPLLLFGTEDMQNYTLTLKAKKHSGNEGFLIPVMWTDENNYFTCNIGGWNNTYSAIQRTVDGTTSEYSVQNTSVHIETDREYEIKVTVEPHKLTLYLDGEVLNFASFKQNVYSTSSFDEESGDIIIKAVNTSDSDMKTVFIINADYINPIASVTELSADDVYSLNSIDNPKNISPITFTTEVSESFTYNLPKNSFTVFRIHTSETAVSEAFDISVSLQKGEELTLPDKVSVKLTNGEEALFPVSWDNIPACATSVSGSFDVSGKISSSDKYVYAHVTVSETDSSIPINPTLTFDDNNVNFSLDFTDGCDGSVVFASVAGYDENNTMTHIKTSRLSRTNPSFCVPLSYFEADKSVKAFLWNNLSEMSSVIIR